ncbi:MAG: PASTA domain-containing protein [Treponema sp.]|jgi:beta-lactam-binding protein with PASTA domain|nr:PASTA domain-containing protein [Treponema sp.]
MGLDLGSIEDSVSGNFRIFIISILVLVVFIGIIAISVFFLVVRGAEQVMVPDVVEKELMQALMELQVKELYPRIQQRYTQTSLDKGLILEQEPKPGTIVKAGRRVRLVVSQGVVLNRVENFVGRNVEDVRMDFNTINATSGSGRLLAIREPVMHEFSSENPGIILTQKPDPGTEISGPTEMVFVVSRGRENSLITIPQLTGLEFSRALQTISTSGVNFRFTTREARGDEKGEVVVSQIPPAGTTAPQNTVVELVLTSPASIGNNEIFGVFRRTIPENPYPLSVRLDAQTPTGETIRLITVNYQGGDFTVPYRLPRDTVLILFMSNRELYRETVN